MAEIDASQLHILHHTLGLRPDCRESYRNHFVAGPGHDDMPDLEALVSAGLMTKTKRPGFIDHSSLVFMATDVGHAYAIEHLPPEPKRTRYQQYLDSDCGNTFAEWLGINEPRYDYREIGSRAEYRMLRISGYYKRDGVSGDWRKTKKAAKASYKEALKASRGKG